MPIYPIKCRGCFRGDAFSTIAEVVKHGGMVRCPSCGKLAEQDYAAKSVGIARDELHGKRQDCHDFQAQPKEVPTLQRMYGDVGHMWQKDGSVKAKDKSEFKKFVQKDQEIRKKFADRKAERAAKGLPVSGKRK
jgi:hypothetical protein